MACWTENLNIENNKFDAIGSGLQLPAAMSFSERSAVEGNLYHKPDNACHQILLISCRFITLQNTYYMTIQAAVNAANPSDQIECAEYSYNERVTIDKEAKL
ncbi:MAG: hypothetical protein R3A12_09880 [Ignavibacteria bacterium]